MLPGMGVKGRGRVVVAAGASLLLAAHAPCFAQAGEATANTPARIEAARAPADSATPAPARPSTLEDRALGPFTPAERRPAGENGGLGADANPGWYREVGRITAALGVVGVLLLLMRVAMRRMTPGLGAAGRPAGVMAVLARYPVGPGQHLVLLRLAGRLVLVHQTKQAMSRITEVTDADEVADIHARIEAGTAPRGGRRFPALLRGMVDAERRGAGTFWPASGGATGRVDGRDIEGNEVIDLTRRRAAPGGRGRRAAS